MTEQDKKLLLQKILEKNALERIARVKLVNPLLAAQVENYLIQLFQAGQLNKIVSDNELKNLLDILIKKRKPKIIRK
ncbi:MAG: hypothetical protein J7K26_01880 [Candidatus Aenigmarchaeota archaeon]|nr:hypothetical protein [Candidatus Aenigmarchaeota archaeon]